MSVDEIKNILYLNLTGSWIYLEEAPLFTSHLKEALRLLKPGFSSLVDLRELVEFSPAVLQLHVAAQKITIAAGLSQLAEVHDLKQLGSLQAIAAAKESGIPLNIFDNPEEAEGWLTILSKK